MRRRCPCANSATSPSAASARAITRSARTPTSSTVSPPGEPCVRHGPARHALADLRRGQPLVVAVVDLDQVLVDLDDVAQPGQLGGVARARAARLTRARARSGGRSSRARSALGGAPPAVQQRDVGRARVPAGRRPLGLAVTHEEDAHAAQPYAPIPSSGAGAADPRRAQAALAAHRATRSERGPRRRLRRRRQHRTSPRSSRTRSPRTCCSWRSRCSAPPTCGAAAGRRWWSRSATSRSSSARSRR